MAAIGIDIGGTNTVIGLVEKNGSCSNITSFKTTDFSNSKIYFQRLSKVIEEVVSSSEPDVNGIGIGAPGVDMESGTLRFAKNIPWMATFNLVEELSRRFSLEVKLINDVKASVNGELNYGVGPQVHDFFYIMLGTGVGGAIVSNQRLVSGHSQMAGEIGHMTTVKDGRTCNCGRRGCLETYVSATGIVRTATKMMENNPLKSILSHKEKIDSESIHKAAMEGDELALKIFDITGRILGEKLAEIVSVIDPQLIVLSGGLSRSGQILLDPTNRYLSDSLPDFYESPVKVVKSDLSDTESVIIGAASILLN